MAIFYPFSSSVWSGHHLWNVPKINAICAELTGNWAGVPAGEHLPLRDYMMALAIRIISSTHFGAFFRNDDNTKALHKLYESVSMYVIYILKQGYCKDREWFIFVVHYVETGYKTAINKKFL